MRVNAVHALPVAALLAAAAAPAQDAARGEAKSAECIACHGPMGISSNPTFPNLAGQHAAYIQLQLENFQTGERYHPLMTPIADSLTQQDINDLAEYYSRIGATAAESR